MSKVQPTTSARRRKASRENGKKGGPKTDSGKLASSKNAIKHGMLSNSLSQYDSIDAQALYDELAVEFDVCTVHQKMLLEQLVLTYVKLSRCNRFEKEIMREKLSAKPPLLDTTDPLLDAQIPIGAKALIDEQTFKRMEMVLTRYEPQLTKRLTSQIEALRRLQKERAS